MSTEQIENAFNEIYFNAGYFQSQKFTTVFINICVSRKKKKVTVVYINKNQFKFIDYEFLAAQGIGRIVIAMGGERRAKKISDGTSQLVIVLGKHLWQPDYDRLLQLSDEFIGCSGDNSFEKAISYNRTPFLQMRPWKSEFLESLMPTLATYLTAEEYFLVRRFIKVCENVLCLDNADADLARADVRPVERCTIPQYTSMMLEIDFDKLAIVWKKLNELFRKHHNYYDNLTRYISQALVYRSCHNGDFENLKRARRVHPFSHEYLCDLMNIDGAIFIGTALRGGHYSIIEALFFANVEVGAEQRLLYLVLTLGKQETLIPLLTEYTESMAKVTQLTLFPKKNTELCDALKQIIIIAENASKAGVSPWPLIFLKLFSIEYHTEIKSRILFAWQEYVANIRAEQEMRLDAKRLAN